VLRRARPFLPVTAAPLPTPLGACPNSSCCIA
jgi:hypothetical protein